MFFVCLSLGYEGFNFGIANLPCLLRVHLVGGEIGMILKKKL